MSQDVRSVLRSSAGVMRAKGSPGVVGAVALLSLSLSLS